MNFKFKIKQKGYVNMKKLLALLLAVLTIVSVFSVNSFAENEPVEELPQIELNLSVTTKVPDENWNPTHCYVIGEKESFQLESNAPNTKYTVKNNNYTAGAKFAKVSEDGLLTVNYINSPTRRFNEEFFELVAEAEGYQTKTYLMYIVSNASGKYIYFDNLKSQTTYVTNVDKNPKVHFVYRDSSFAPYDDRVGYEEDASQKIEKVSSSNQNVATVNLVRKFTPKNNKDNPYEYEYLKYLDIHCFKPGNTTITVEDGAGIKASFKLYVQQNTTAVQTIGVGEKYTPHFLDENPSFNAGNNSVKFSGKYIVGNKPGKTTVSFLYNGVREHITFIVKKAPTKVSLNVTKRTMGLSDSLDLNSSVPKGCASRIRRYYSSNTKVAKVHPTNGMVTPVGSGTCKIVCKTYNGKKATCYITVKSDPKKIIVAKPVIRAPYSLAYDVPYFYKLNPKNKDKDYIQINAKTDNGTNGKFTYKSSDTRIVKVNNKGRIYVCDECLDYNETWTYGKNTAYITITAYNGVKAVVKVIVYNDAKECKNYTERGNRKMAEPFFNYIKKMIPGIKEGKITKANLELRKEYEEPCEENNYTRTWTGKYLAPYDWLGEGCRVVDVVSKNSTKDLIDQFERYQINLQLMKAIEKKQTTYYAMILEQNEYYVIVW